MLRSLALQGDSGFLLVRDGRPVFKSPALQHFFDCPLQFAAHPDYTSATDNAEDAAVYAIDLMPGDWVVAASDGLWDNVHQEEITAVLERSGGDAEKVID
jgi:protein phosphatase PTC7